MWVLSSNMFSINTGVLPFDPPEAHISSVHSKLRNTLLPSSSSASADKDQIYLSSL